MGNLDLIITGYNLFTSFTKVYRNNGDNTFTEQVNFSLPPLNTSCVKWGDYDNDGDLDILLTGFSGFYNLQLTKIFKNNGDGTFTEDTSAILPGIGSSSVSWGDYDNDGDLDILLTGNTPSESVSKIFRNDLAVVNIKPAAPATPVAIVTKSDVTLTWKSVRTDNTSYKSISYNLRIGTSNNGGFSLLTPHSSSTGFRRINTIGNSFLDTTYYLKKLPFGTYYWSVQAIDNGFAGGPFSSEGSFSVVPVQAKNLSAKILNANSLLLKWERGNGDRCAVFCKQTATGPASPNNNNSYIADPEYGFGSQLGNTGWYCVYNGRADSVAVTGLVFNKQYSFQIIEYMGTFGTEQYFSQVADGNPGVFSTSLFAEQSAITLNTPLNNKAVWGDYDNDGYVDLLIPGLPTRIYRNNEDNTFVEKTGITLVDVNYGSAAWGDYDNDGDLDIIITGATNFTFPSSGIVIKIFRNDGADIFTEQTQIVLTPVHYSSVAWGDYDNDGDLDILITGAPGVEPNFNPVSKIYRNNGNSTFTEQTQIQMTGIVRGSGTWADYDNDGDLDVLIVGATDYQTSGNGLAKIYRNNGNNTFSEQTQINNIKGYGYSASSWGDFDNDGDLDLVTTTQGYMNLYRNMGNGVFTDYFSFSLSYQGPCYAAFGDYNNDGYLDLLLTNPGLDTKLYRNTHGIIEQGAVSQWFKEQDDESIKSLGYSFASWIDYDNDGDIDLLFSKEGLPVSKIFRNNLVMRSGLLKSNIQPSTPKGLSAVNSPQGIILKWSPVKNDETPYNSLTYNVKIGTSKSGSEICPSNSSITGYRKIPAVGNAQTDTTFIIENLPATKYFWSVQAVDQAFKGGAWSVVDSFDVKNILSYFTADTVCQGVATTFTNQSTAFGDVIRSYLWNFGDGTTSVLQNPTYIFSTPGTKIVKLISYSPTSSDTLVKQVIVKAKPPVNFTATTACQGAETLITNTTNTAGLIITSWSWDYGDGKGSVAQNPVSHGFLNAGDYQVTLTASSDNNCSGTLIKTVSVGAYPVVPVTANSPLLFCNGDSVTLSVSSNPTYTYNWLLNGTPLTGGNAYSFKARVTGSYTVEVINTKGNCKTTSNAASVVALNAPVKPLIDKGSYNEGMCLGETPIKLKAETVTPGYTYHWFRNGSSFSNSSTSVIEGLLQPGIYKLQADLGGCKSKMDSVNLVFADALPKPDIFAKGPTVWYLVCNNETASSYKWYFNGTLIPGADKYQYIANQKLGKIQCQHSKFEGLLHVERYHNNPERNYRY